MSQYKDYGIGRNLWIRFLLAALRKATVRFEREAGRTFGVILVPWGETIPSERMFRAAFSAATQERQQIAKANGG
jgi:hypothetical protein